jgi:acyl-[acyl-carrier-protein]-phospholipid O-acyltransferase/long-chain-fatty-acid--[acyl-carrier-protein] ligase
LLLECALARGMSELCVPRQIMVTDSVPVLGSGKIDYRKARELLPKEVS